MRPAFSVVFLTTLIGAGQGLFLALFAAEAAGAMQGRPVAELRPLMVSGSALALVLCGLGLIASFFHLGHPERAWRAATCWRTSWLSREVIALPAFMAALALYGAMHYVGGASTLTIGAAAVILCIALYVSTGMVYASIRIIREWASAFTIVNYSLLGAASGFTLATALAALLHAAPAVGFAKAAMVLTLAGLLSRAASLVRNARLKPKTTLQTAIGVKHPRIVQKAQGSMGGSFNTREFFHGKPDSVLRAALWGFVLLACIVPLLLLQSGSGGASGELFAIAFASQYLGLLAERWLFFAQANHPQNLYYRSIA